MSALLLGALLLGGLSGCKFDDNRPSFTETDLYKKKVRPAEINSLTSNDAINAPAGLSLESQATQLPRPKPEDAVIVEDTTDKPGEGERATGWKGLYDVYWKLNWARKELLNGNVSHDLADVITSTRKHCNRLANEFPRLDGMGERLDAANSALDHLDSGLQQMNKLVVLKEAGLDWRNMPWGSGIDEMHQYLERMGLAAPSVKSSSSVNPSLSQSDDSSAPAKSEDALPYATSRQRDGVAMALRCERENHVSPEELARVEFQAGMRDIIRLRDLCALTYHAASVPGDSTVIDGLLHMEENGAAPPRTAPLDKSTGLGLSTHFDPTASPGQNRNAPLIR